MGLHEPTAGANENRTGDKSNISELMKNWKNKLDLLNEDGELLNVKKTKHDLRRGKKRKTESPVRLWKNSMG